MTTRGFLIRMAAGAIVAAVMGAVTWLTYGWVTALSVVVGVAVAFGVGGVIATRPASSRVNRWGPPLAWFTYAGIGLALSLGVPDRDHRGLGTAIVISAIGVAWGSRMERLKPLMDRVMPPLYFMFGEPDPGSEKFGRGVPVGATFGLGPQHVPSDPGDPPPA